MKLWTSIKDFFSGGAKDSTEPRKGETFEQYIDRQKLRHFTGAELARYFTRKRGDVRNDYPHLALWHRFLPTLRLVDDLRHTLGCPVRITSHYRSPAYNKAVNGAPMSQHLAFRAADLQADGATPHEVYKILKLWRDQGRFQGGLGLYSTFVHVDTRGTNADW
jgi:uncharacterized protein YcbK (DUF882 family)